MICVGKESGSRTICTLRWYLLFVLPLQPPTAPPCPGLLTSGWHVATSRGIRQGCWERSGVEQRAIKPHPSHPVLSHLQKCKNKVDTTAFVWAQAASWWLSALLERDSTESATFKRSKAFLPNGLPWECWRSVEPSCLEASTSFWLQQIFYMVEILEEMNCLWRLFKIEDKCTNLLYLKD